MQNTISNINKISLISVVHQEVIDLSTKNIIPNTQCVPFFYNTTQILLQQQENISDIYLYNEMQII